MKDVIRIASKGSAVIMRETLIVIRNECEESIPVARKVVSIIRVTDSSLCVIVSFTTLLTRYSYPHSEWWGTARRHPERMWKIYTRGEEYSKMSSVASVKDLPSWREKIQKIHLSNFTTKIISMSWIISISLKKLYSYKWQNKAFLFLCYKLRFMNMLLTIRQKHTIQTRSKKLRQYTLLKT